MTKPNRIEFKRALTVRARFPHSPQALTREGEDHRLHQGPESRLESPLIAKLLVLRREPTGKAPLGHASVSSGLHKQVKRLLALHLIEMTLPEKPNSRLQQYRLTDPGRPLLDQPNLDE